MSPVDCVVSEHSQASLTGLIVIQERGYVVKEGRALRATSRGRVLSAFLQQYFSQYVDYEFTSDMESQLDDVAGDLARLQCTHCISEHTHARTNVRAHARTHVCMHALSLCSP